MAAAILSIFLSFHSYFLNSILENSFNNFETLASKIEHYY